jgi:hypothetical protein
MKLAMIALVALLAIVVANGALAQEPAKTVVLASEIPVAHTPRGFWKTFPEPVLARCTESLAPGAPDLRGVWTGDNNGKTHVERIQQCGDRVVIDGGGVTHDMRADGTLAHGVHDIAAGTALPIKVAAVFENNGLSLKPFGGPVLVTRALQGDTLVFTYAGKVILLHRAADLPPGL